MDGKVFDFYKKFEVITKEIFTKTGYKVTVLENEATDKKYDVEAQAENKTYFIEVKATTEKNYNNVEALNRAIQQLLSSIRTKNEVGVLFVYGFLPDNIRARIKLDERVILYDIIEILSAIRGTETFLKLSALLNYKIDFDRECANPLGLGWIEHNDRISDYIKRINTCPAGCTGAAEFEKICFDVLQYIFSEDLTLWSVQTKSNNELYRFDLLCRIKNGVTKDFWTIIERFFGTKYVVFEYKNYTESITQREIYTTEKYLYGKALRNVAIIVARNGFDENAVWATKGALRENGKLMILINVKDMERMLQSVKTAEDPSLVLLEKLDDMLITLEK